MPHLNPVASQRNPIWIVNNLPAWHAMQVDLCEAGHFGKVIVAIANKHARQIWTMLAHGVDYDPQACLNHPMHQRAAQAA